MRVVGIALGVAAALTGCAAAFGQDSAVPAMPEVVTDPSAWIAFGTYAGIAAATTLLVEWLKKIITKGPLDGREPLLAIAIAPVLGAVSKLVGIGFADIPWGGHVVTLVLVGAVGAKLVHDDILNPLLGKHIPKK